MGDLGQRHDDAAADRIAGVQAGQRAELEHRGARVDQRLEALAHHHLAAGAVALDVLRAPAGQHVVVQVAHLVDQRPMASALARNSSPETASRVRMGVLTGSCSHDGPALLEEGLHPLGRLRSGEQFGRPAAPPRARRTTPRRRARQQRLGGGTAPGADLRRRQRPRAPTQASSAGSSSTTAVSSPAAAASRRAEGLTGEHGTGEEAPVHHAQGRHQDHGRRHADPDLAEGERGSPPSPRPGRPPR